MKDFYIIDDFFIERSYLSKTRLRNILNDSIYTGDSVTIKPEIVNRPALHDDRTTTDIIIDGLKSRPQLLSALQRGLTQSTITEVYKVKNAQLLINFYNKHKDIIDN